MLGLGGVLFVFSLMGGGFACFFPFPVIVAVFVCNSRVSIPYVDRSWFLACACGRCAFSYSCCLRGFPCLSGFLT